VATLGRAGDAAEAAADARTRFARATSGPARELPHRAQMEQLFGRGLGDVAAHVGADLSGLGALAAARGDTVAFAEAAPAPSRVAHEVAHVLQQRAAGTAAVAASRDVAPADDSAEHEAESIAAHVEAGGADAAPVAVTAAPAADVHLDRGNRAGPDDRGFSDGRPELLDWAGAAPIRDTRTHQKTATATAGDDSLKILTEYAYGVQTNREMGGNAVYAVRRTMRAVLRSRGKADQVVDLVVKSTAYLGVDTRPRDITVLVNTPAVLANNVGELEVHEPYSSRVPSGELHARGKSLADLVGGDRLIAFETPAAERLSLLEQRLHTMRTGDILADRVDHMIDNTKPHIAQLKEHKRLKEAYRDGNWAHVEAAGKFLEAFRTDIETLEQNIARGAYDPTDGKKQLERLEAAYHELYFHYEQARRAHARQKGLAEHAWDIGGAQLRATGKLIGGFVEVGRMIRDGVTKVADEIVQGVSDYQIDWEPYSAVGKAYAEGKTTTQIAEMAIDGMVTEVKEAFERAKNGDFSAVSELAAGVAQDVALTFATGGGGAVATGARFVVKTGEVLANAAKFSKHLLARLPEIAERAKQLAKLAPTEMARRATLMLGGWIEDLVTPLRHYATAGGPDAFLLLDKAKGLFRTRQLDEVVGSTAKALAKRRGGSSVNVTRFATRLTARAAGPAHKATVVRVVEMLAHVKDPAGYTRRVTALLDGGRLTPEDLFGVLARSIDFAAGKGDVAKFLDDVAWFAGRKLNAAARSNVLRRVAAGEAPDLAWLRSVGLTEKRLEFLADNAATNWKSFMKVSEKPSDMFPMKLDKRGLDNKAYADAGAKLRGAAGEIVVGEMPLPDGLKIVRSQVEPTFSDDVARTTGARRGKIIDYVVNANGQPGWLEVKAWSARTWIKQLDGYTKHEQDASKWEQLHHLLTQLDAAKQAVPSIPGARLKPGTKAQVYLAITDKLADDKVKLLERVLAGEGHANVKIIKFSDDKVKAVAKELKQAMVMTGVGAAVIDAAIDDDSEAGGT
jgi:hypothetical protein